MPKTKKKTKAKPKAKKIKRQTQEQLDKISCGSPKVNPHNPIKYHYKQIINFVLYFTLHFLIQNNVTLLQIRP